MSDESKILHQRLRRTRGNAKTHNCVSCGSPAFDWAYQHTDEEALVDSRGQVYSRDFSHYAPMCRSCHRKLDYKMNPASLKARAEQLRQLPRESEEMARRGRLGAAVTNRKG